MTDKALLQRFDTWRSEGRSLVLATVVATAGATYTKAGHRILIADSGDFEGLVSGGCLEGDLATHAGQVTESGQTRVVTYDLRETNDELFGLGIGCDGLLRILLQRLSPADAYEPFAAIAASMRGDVTVHCALVVGEQGDLPMGTTLISADASSAWSGLAAAKVLYLPLRPLPRLLVLGAGQDAVPVVALADLLGWRVTVADHRPAYLDLPAFAVADTRVAAPAAELASAVPLSTFAAAIVMSHHLATDHSYLVVLAKSAVPYIGLLGPPGRRDRLLQELGSKGNALAGRLHGPAGLDIGADSPESIALSILAEIHALSRARG
jgi:xanthine dehydrogenase accessory factor